MDLTCFGFASISAVLFACAFYGAFVRTEHSAKQKSWIVTLLSSTIMSCGSLPFLWDFCSSGGVIHSVNGSTEVLAQALCGSFQGFLVADLSLGSLFYRQQISLIFGWVHHVAYIYLMQYVAKREWTPYFALCLAMEIPTSYLSTSILWPRWRNDHLYTITFFTFRICFHALLFVQFVNPKHAQELVQGSSIPSILLALTFALHTSALTHNVKKLVKCDAQRGATSIDSAPNHGTSTSDPLPPSLRRPVAPRRRSSFSEYLIAKSRTLGFKKRGAVLLALPLFYTLAKLSYQYRSFGVEGNKF